MYILYVFIYTILYIYYTLYSFYTCKIYTVASRDIWQIEPAVWNLAGFFVLRFRNPLAAIWEVS